MKITKLMAVLLLLALVLTVPAAAAETLPPIYVGYQKLEAIPDRWNPLEAMTPALLHLLKINFHMFLLLQG